MRMIKWVYLFLVTAVYHLPERTVSLLASCLMVLIILSSVLVLSDSRVQVGALVHKQSLPNDQVLVTLKVPLVDKLFYSVTEQRFLGDDIKSRWLISVGTPQSIVAGSETQILVSHYSSSFFPIDQYIQAIGVLVHRMVPEMPDVLVVVGVFVVLFGMFILRASSGLALGLACSLLVWHWAHTANAFGVTDLADLLIYQLSSCIGVMTGAIGLRAREGVAALLLRRLSSLLLVILCVNLFVEQYAFSEIQVGLLALCALVLPLLSYASVGAVLISTGLAHQQLESFITYAVCFCVAAVVVAHSLRGDTHWYTID